MVKVAVLAGGLGTRLGEETAVRPKPMVEIGGRPMLWHILTHYASYGHNEFLVALGYKGEVIKDYFLNYYYRRSSLTIDLASGEVQTHGSDCEDWRVHLIDTGQDTNTGGRVRRLKPWVGRETFMLTYGDGVGDVDLHALLAFHRRHGRLATITAVRPPARFGSLDFLGDQVIRFVEKPQAGEGWINGGFFVLEPEVLNYIQDDDTSLERDTLEHLAGEGQLMAYWHEGFWQCMDTLRDVKYLEKLWSDGAAPCAKRPEGGLMQMAGRLGIAADAECRNCYTIVTSPACGRGRGLSRGRGRDVNKGRFSGQFLRGSATLSPLPGLRARPLPQGEVTRKADPHRQRETFSSTRADGQRCFIAVSSLGFLHPNHSELLSWTETLARAAGAGHRPHRFQRRLAVALAAAVGRRSLRLALAPPTEPSLFQRARVGDGMIDWRIDVQDRRRRPPGFGLVPAQRRVSPGRSAAGPPLVSRPGEHVRHERDGDGASPGGGPPGGQSACHRGRDQRQVLRKPRVDLGVPRERPAGRPRSIQLEQGLRRTGHGRLSPVVLPRPAGAGRRRLGAAGNVIGGGDWAADRLVPDILRALGSGEEIVVRNPRAVRPWQHVLEPLRGYLMLAQRLVESPADFAEAWNFGPRDDDARPVQDLVQQAIELWGSGSWRVPPSAGAPHEARLLKLDCSQARERLGWQPRLGLERCSN